MTVLTSLIQAKVSDRQLVRIKAAAQAQGISTADLVRAAVLAYIGDPDGSPSVHDRLRALEEQVHELQLR